MELAAIIATLELHGIRPIKPKECTSAIRLGASVQPNSRTSIWSDRGGWRLAADFMPRGYEFGDWPSLRRPALVGLTPEFVQTLIEKLR